MFAEVVIERYTDDFAPLLPLLQMSMGLESMDGVQHLLAIEQTKGTRYYVARVQQQFVGLIGVWVDPTHTIAEIEPPQIIDMAVFPNYRRQGIARALMRQAVHDVPHRGL